MLEEVTKILEQRRAEYGSPQKMYDIAWKLAMTLDIDSLDIDDCSKSMLFEICLKLGRLTEKPQHKDSYLDIAGYLALIHDNELEKGRRYGPGGQEYGVMPIGGQTE